MSQIHSPAAEQPQPRLVHLDILRGFALLGILLINMNAFVLPTITEYLNQEASTFLHDRLTADFLGIFVRGKFYTIFALLFGASFALMATKANQVGNSFFSVYLRRILVLGVIGLLHSVLIWTGDILLLYSMTAILLLLFFRKTKSSRLLKWSLACYISVLIFTLIAALAGEMAKLDPIAHKELTAGLQQSMESIRSNLESIEQAYLYGNYSQVLEARMMELREVWNLYSGTMLMILGHFLLGAWLIRSDRLVKVHLYRGFYRNLLRWGLLIGLPLSYLSVALLKGQNYLSLDLPVMLASAAQIIGHPMLALAYIAAILLIGMRRPLFHWFAPAGQMALTNYLLQSLFWTTVCYGYGLGLATSLSSRFLQILLACGFFILQAVFSHWWLVHFSQGPLEWLWRSISYWQWQPLRRPQLGLKKPSMAQS